MIKAILFAALFTFVGLVVFALLGPLIFPGANPRRMGQMAAPIMVGALGITGFIFGWRRPKKP